MRESGEGVECEGGVREGGFLLGGGQAGEAGAGEGAAGLEGCCFCCCRLKGIESDGFGGEEAEGGCVEG